MTMDNGSPSMVNFYIRLMKFKHPIAAKEIAEWTNSQIIGDENALIHGLNEIHNVEEGDLTFVDHEKYYDFTLKSKATFIIINKRVVGDNTNNGIPEGKVLLYHANPFEAYNFLAEK